MAASQSSCASSVKERLPDHCFLNLSDDDEDTLEQLQSVEDTFFSLGTFLDDYDDTNLSDIHELESDDPEQDDEVDVVQEEIGNVAIEPSDEDLLYTAEIETFRNAGCGCTLYHGGKHCCSVIGMDVIEAVRLNMLEIPRDDLDLIILGHLQQNRVKTDETTKTKSHTKISDRKRASMNYYVNGQQVCKKTYLFTYGIGEKRFKNLCKHFDEYGLTPRKHGNAGKCPKNAISAEREQTVITYIKNYAEENAMPLPGRMPRMRDYTVMMLPSDTTKADIWKKYVESCDPSVKPVGLTTFKRIWARYLPNIAVMKIASDLCETCQNNNNLIMKSVNCSEEEKSARLKAQEKHLNLAKECRDYYRQDCQQSSEYWQGLSDIEKESGVVEGPLHYSFDYAQSVFIPHSAQQVGPIYFKTPRKCGIFGVCAEHKPEQINYLIDEDVCTGKGANETISYLHHFLENCELKVNRLKFHSDNCVGQNKNNAVMQYFCWRTIQGYNSKIESSFMLPYHTRFGPDWCFGLLKLKYRRSQISSIFELAKVVNDSTKKDINLSQLISDPTTKQTLVTMYNWKSFLDKYFIKIPGITKYHHFSFDSSNPGVVVLKEFPSTEEKSFKILKSQKGFDGFPETLVPKGLSAERAWYLYKHIREHVSDECKDITCPKPLLSKPKATDILKQGRNKDD